MGQLLLTTFQAAIALFGSSVIANVIYKTFVQPLSAIPGPKYLAFSEIPHAFLNWFLGRWYTRALHLHEKYGPIVRVGSNTLLVDGSIGWDQVYSHRRADEPEFEKALDYFPTGAHERLHSIIVSDRQNHRRQRRLISSAFSDAAISSHEGIITEYVNLLIARLGEQAATGTPIDIVKWYNFFTFDLIGDLAFGEPFGCLRDGQMHPWVSLIFIGIKAMSFLRFVATIPFLWPVVQFLIGGTVLEKQAQHKVLVKAKTERRMALGASPQGKKWMDFMTYILQGRKEEDGRSKGLTDQEIRGNAETFIVAGSETTATVLSGLTYFLTQNQQAMRRLTKEIRSSFFTEEDITMRSVAPLPYLQACIDEAMRLYPPASETPPRLSPGARIAGYWVPKGTWIFVNQWATNRLASNFSHPSTYHPERWLSPSHPYHPHDSTFTNDNKAAFQPFSYGPRNCIGKNLAYAEMRLVVARLLWTFDIKLQEGFEGWMEGQRVYTTWEKPELKIQLTAVPK